MQMSRFPVDSDIIASVIQTDECPRFRNHVDQVYEPRFSARSVHSAIDI